MIRYHATDVRAKRVSNTGYVFYGATDVGQVWIKLRIENSFIPLFEINPIKSLTCAVHCATSFVFDMDER